MSRARAESVSLLSTLLGIGFAGLAVVNGWFGALAVAPLGAAAWLQYARRGPTDISFSKGSWTLAGDHYEVMIPRAELGQGKVPVMYTPMDDGSHEVVIPDFRLTPDGDLVISARNPWDCRIAVA